MLGPTGRKRQDRTYEGEGPEAYRRFENACALYSELLFSIASKDIANRPLRTPTSRAKAKG